MEGKFLSDQTGYLVEEISKKSVERAAWFVLTASNEMREERRTGGMN